jgi:hypothetical protein
MLKVCAAIGFFLHNRVIGRLKEGLIKRLAMKTVEESGGLHVEIDL